MRSYARLWAVTEFVIGYGTIFLVPGCHAFFPSECHETPWWFYGQCVLWALIMIRPWRLFVVVAMLVRVAQYWVQSPFIWESCHWANATELAFVAALLLCPLDAVVRESQDLIRTMMGIFYVGAGFWKINSSFLDPTVSCGPIYVASLLTTFVPEGLRPSWLVGPALRSAAWMTILGECGIGLCLLLPSRSLRRMGFVLSNLLHYAICITPFPNAVPLFGVFCYTRLFLVLPHAWTVALDEALSLPRTVAGFATRALCVALAAASGRCTSVPGIDVDWGIPAQTLLCCLGARAVVLDIQFSARWTAEAAINGVSAKAAASRPSRRPSPSSTSSTFSTSPTSSASSASSSAAVTGWRRLLLRLNSTVWRLVVCFYVFGAQTLGLFSISATSPFSAIREHGGSNHLFMPTGLLQQWPSTRGLDLFSGGVVRVTHSVSSAAVRSPPRPHEYSTRIATKNPAIAEASCPKKMTAWMGAARATVRGRQSSMHCCYC